MEEFQLRKPLIGESILALFQCPMMKILSQLSQRRNRAEAEVKKTLGIVNNPRIQDEVSSQIFGMKQVPWFVVRLPGTFADNEDKEAWFRMDVGVKTRLKTDKHAHWATLLHRLRSGSNCNHIKQFVNIQFT